jgi:hypothetical protein
MYMYCISAIGKCILAQESRPICCQAQDPSKSSTKEEVGLLSSHLISSTLGGGWLDGFWATSNPLP